MMPMLTLADHIYPASFRLLSGVVDAIHHNKTGLAQKLIEDAKKQRNPMDANERLQVDLFLYAMEQRLSKSGLNEESNPYLVSDQNQQIRLFNLMAEKFLAVKYSQTIVNQAIIQKALKHQNILLMDIGTGTGRQMIQLIKALAEKHSDIKQIHVIGIEPSSDTLKIAEESTIAISKDLNVPISYTAIHATAQEMTEKDWALIRRIVHDSDAALFINASFALHHIKPLRMRQSLFKTLQSLNPKLLTLIEPYSHHTVLNLKKRFQYAWHHYGLAFKAIDSIQIDESDKQQIKSVFFSREIQDVISVNKLRVEQFETAEMWLTRLEKAHFKPILLEDFEPANAELPPNLSILHRDGYAAIAVDGFPLVGIIGCESSVVRSVP